MYVLVRAVFVRDESGAVVREVRFVCTYWVFLCLMTAPLRSSVSVRVLIELSICMWACVLTHVVFALQVGSNVDITQIKLAELELHRLKEAAQQSNKAKSVFISHISHEIRVCLCVSIACLALPLADCAVVLRRRR